MKYKIAGILLCTLALIRVVADVFGLERLSAAAAVTNAAPAMKVFTAQKGYETYSSPFELTIRQVNGETLKLRLSPSNYSGLKGPYNRRNVYGALMAYGPVLVANPRTRTMWEVMAQRAFCGQPGIVAELTDDHLAAVESVTIDYPGQVQTGSEYPHQLGVSCE